MPLPLFLRTAALSGLFGLAQVVVLSSFAPAQPSSPPYTLGSSASHPVIFAEGAISTGDYESHPAFTPDGETIYFLKDSPDFSFWTIFVSHFQNGRWSEPELAPFAGQYRDADPFITADGSKFFFISDRPVPGKTHHDLDIWVMDKNGDGWSDPRNLGAPVNSEGEEWYPTVASDGTLYFGSDRPGGKGKTDLYRSRLIGGKYSEPENLGGVINTDLNEYEPFIAPDQSYLIFMADNRDGRGDSDLFLSYQRDGAWTKPVPLGGEINSAGNEYSPKVSPDGHYFFWSSTRSSLPSKNPHPLVTREYLKRIRSAGNGLGDIYQIDIGALQLH